MRSGNKGYPFTEEQVVKAGERLISHLGLSVQECIADTKPGTLRVSIRVRPWFKRLVRLPKVIKEQWAFTAGVPLFPRLRFILAMLKIILRHGVKTNPAK